MASHLLLLLVFLLSAVAAPKPSSAALPGSWELLLTNAGIASMHTAVTRFGTVVLLDRTNIGPSRKLLPHGRCRYDPHDHSLHRDCYAHSVLFDPTTLHLRPLTILTDTWCSSGQFLPDGTLLQSGGDLFGARKFRKFSPCPSSPFALCDWHELPSPELTSPRWYATNQILPDGSVAVVGGRGVNTIEYFPPSSRPAADLPFLASAEDPQMDNLYPYVHLLPSGHLFIFANTISVVYDYAGARVVRRLPDLPGGPRNYPSAGSSVMLPLESSNFDSAEVVICGGAAYGAFVQRSTDAPAHGSCGRISATKSVSEWALEDMPFGRIMGDMVLLPTGEAVIINGAHAGTQGFEQASEPALYPVLYRPTEPVGLRFMTMAPTSISRMYHSTANLLPDGRVLVAGSNPHYFYNFRAAFPTELRLEAFSPEYLSPDRANLRPAIQLLPETLRYGDPFDVEVTVPLPVVGTVEVNIASAPFATHSFSQGQRLVKLHVAGPVPREGRYRIGCVAPPRPEVAPPGYYMAFAVNQGVPSVAKWVQLIL